MVKLHSNPVTASDLSDYLKTSDDFQFEQDVFRSCLKGGFPAQHGGTYQDPVTKKDRQFDIRMCVTKGLCRLKLAIECKNLRANFPLLVSRVQRRPEESFHEVILSGASRYQDAVFMGSNTRAATHKTKGPVTLYQSRQFVGKATVQVGRTPNGDLTTGDAEVYEKWAQAIASAFDLVSQSVRDFERTDRRNAYSVVIPVLVVADGSLWTADYSEQGELLAEPSPCEECTIFIGKKISTRGVDYEMSHLHVFTKTKFDGYLDRVTVNDKYWDLIFPSDQLSRSGA